MVEAYIEACQHENIRPIQKLLEQLEVSTIQPLCLLCAVQLAMCVCVVATGLLCVSQRLDDLSTPIDTLDLASTRLDYRTCESLEIVLSQLRMTSLDVQKSNIEDDVSEKEYDLVLIELGTAPLQYTR